MSLSPRPERFTTITVRRGKVGARRMAAATAWALSSAAMMPSRSASVRSAASASSSVTAS